MGLRPTKGHEDALWQIRLAGGSACPTLAPVGQALPPANRRLQRSRCLYKHATHTAAPPLDPPAPLSAPANNTPAMKSPPQYRRSRKNQPVRAAYFIEKAREHLAHRTDSRRPRPRRQCHHQPFAQNHLLAYRPRLRPAPSEFRSRASAAQPCKRAHRTVPPWPAPAPRRPKIEHPRRRSGPPTNRNSLPDAAQRLQFEPAAGCPPRQSRGEWRPASALRHPHR